MRIDSANRENVACRKKIQKLAYGLQHTHSALGITPRDAMESTWAIGFDRLVAWLERGTLRLAEPDDNNRNSRDKSAASGVGRSPNNNNEDDNHDNHGGPLGLKNEATDFQDLARRFVNFLSSEQREALSLVVHGGAPFSKSQMVPIYGGMDMLGLEKERQSLHEETQVSRALCEKQKLLRGGGSPLIARRPTDQPTNPQPNEAANEIEGYSQFYDAGVGSGVDLGTELDAHNDAHNDAHAVVDTPRGVVGSDAPYESPWGEGDRCVNGHDHQGGYQYEHNGGHHDHGLQSAVSPSNYAVSELSHPQGGETLQDEFQTLAQPVDGADASVTSPTPTLNTEQIHEEDTVGWRSTVPPPLLGGPTTLALRLTPLTSPNR